MGMGTGGKENNELSNSTTLRNEQLTILQYRRLAQRIPTLHLEIGWYFVVFPWEEDWFVGKV